MDSTTSSTPRDSSAAGPAAPKTVRIRAGEPADLLSYIDHSLGYRPRTSVVGLTRRGSTIGALVRLDWPEQLRKGTASPEYYAETIAAHLAQDLRATDSLIFLLSDRVHAEPGSTDQFPIRSGDIPLVDALHTALRGRDLPLRETWLVDTGRIWHMDCPDLDHCPSHGSSVARSEISAVNATFILEGSVVDEGPEIARMPEPAPEPSPQLQAARHYAPSTVEDPCLTLGWMELWDRILEGEIDLWDNTAGPNEFAGLLAGLEIVPLRDALLASAAFSLPRALSGAEHMGLLPKGTCFLGGTRPTAANGVLYVSVLMADTSRGPSWARLDRLVDACRYLIPHASGPSASALQCLAAWVEWCRGRGSRAGAIIDDALRRDPEYSLAQLIFQLIDQGHIASWAAREEVAWRQQRG